MTATPVADLLRRAIETGDWSGVAVIDLDSDECAELLGGFIAARPEVWDEDIGE